MVDFSDFSNITDAELSLIPDGQHQFTIVSAKEQLTKTGKVVINIQATPTDGGLYFDLFHSIFLPSPEDTEKQNIVSKSNLKKFFAACGYEIPAGEFDLEELIGQTFWAITKTIPERDGYPAKTAIKQFVLE